jgi:hypothetical protein
MRLSAFLFDWDDQENQTALWPEEEEIMANICVEWPFSGGEYVCSFGIELGDYCTKWLNSIALGG